MSPYKHFAIAGAGTIGKVIAEQLIVKKDAGKILSIKVLTRSSGCQEDLIERDVQVVLVDYSRPCTLRSALAGVDVVISSLSLLSIAHQDALASSAKTVGVRLLVPSDFESILTPDTEILLQKQKQAIRDRLKELELPYAVFCTGLFSDRILAPTFAAAMDLDFVVGEFSIPGSGTAAISWTTVEDIARFIAHVLTSLPRERIEWRIFRVEADRIGLNGIVAQWERRFQRTAAISHRPRSAFKEAIKKNPVDFLSHFILELDAGHMAVGQQDELSNDEFPEWRPKRVIDVLDDIYSD